MADDSLLHCRVKPLTQWRSQTHLMACMLVTGELTKGVLVLCVRLITSSEPSVIAPCQQCHCADTAPSNYSLTQGALPEEDLFCTSDLAAWLHAVCVVREQSLSMTRDQCLHV